MLQGGKKDIVQNYISGGGGVGGWNLWLYDCVQNHGEVFLSFHFYLTLLTRTPSYLNSPQEGSGAVFFQ